MNKSYLVRAKVGGELFLTTKQIPVKFGQFLMDYSPNGELWCIKEGIFDPNPEKGLPQEDKNYPISLLYVDTDIEVEKGQNPYIVADDILEQVEAMLRLSRSGDIYLRRHELWRFERGSPKLPIDEISIQDFPLLTIKPEPSPLYERGEYKLDDETLGRFIEECFNPYWNIVRQKPQPLYNALFRFSSSYEKRTLADRLVELI